MEHLGQGSANVGHELGPCTVLGDRWRRRRQSLLAEQYVPLIAMPLQLMTIYLLQKHRM
jgi:hypothetical protein